MNKRIKNKHTKESFTYYRDIQIAKNSCYSYKESRVVIFTPDIERYSKNKSGVRSMIDRFLRTYKEDNFPF